MYLFFYPQYRSKWDASTFKKVVLVLNAIKSTLI